MCYILAVLHKWTRFCKMQTAPNDLVGKLWGCHDCSTCSSSNLPKISQKPSSIEAHTSYSQIRHPKCRTLDFDCFATRKGTLEA